MRSLDFTLLQFWMRKYFCVAAVGSKTMSDPLWFEQNATVMIPGCEGEMVKRERVKRGGSLWWDSCTPLRPGDDDDDHQRSILNSSVAKYSVICPENPELFRVMILMTC